MSEQETFISPVAKNDIDEEDRQEKRTPIAVHKCDIEVR